MKRSVEVMPCSITETGAKIVVNASNEKASLGGGVSAALARECGAQVLQDEMREKLADLGGSLDEGDCLVTGAGTSTKFRHVLHVPAVDYSDVRARHGRDGVERTVTNADRVRSCVEAALAAAADLAADEGREVSLAFPLLGAGSGGLPVEAVCRVMITGLRSFFSERPDARIARVFFAVPEPDRFAICKRLVVAAFGAASAQ